MNIFKYIFTCVIVCLILWLQTACSRNEEPEYYRMYDRIERPFLKEMESKYKLLCRGHGGAFMDNISEITLSFVTYGPKSISELRQLMIEISEDFLSRMNENEEIRPYLSNYPFNAKNLDFSISLYDKKGDGIKNKGSEKLLLQGVMLINGKLSYNIDNEEFMYLQTVHRETYDEAKELAGQKKGIN